MLERHMKLVDEYFKDFNKTAATQRCGFAHPDAQSGRLFARKDVQAEIAKRQEKIAAKYEISREWIVERLMMMADAGKILSKYIEVQEDGTLAWNFAGVSQEELRVVQGMMVEMYMEGRGPGARSVKKFKIDTADPKGALDSLARIAGLFNDKLKVEGEITLADRLQKGRQRVKKGE